MQYTRNISINFEKVTQCKFTFKLEWLLLSVRIICISFMFLAVLDILLIGFEMQLILAASIFITDFFDGIISRKQRGEREQYYFRIADSFVDKTGILIIILGLLIMSKITIFIFLIILSYNIILVTAPIILIAKNKQTRVTYIQATFWSRLYAALTGVYCLIANNFILYKTQNIMIALIFIEIGLVSFASHYKKKNAHYHLNFAERKK